MSGNVERQLRTIACSFFTSCPSTIKHEAFASTVTHHRLANLAAVMLLAASPLFTRHAQSQTPPSPNLNRNVIFLDPAHGGPDTGALLPNHVAEKDVTLAFNARLRAALATAGFAAISPRDADPTTVILPDQRAALANRARPLACILLHATANGSGIHLFTAPETGDGPQSTFSRQSLSLGNLLGVSLLGAKLPVLLTHASIAPLDNLTCPAVALEVAPLPDGNLASTNAAYQQRIAKAIVAALEKWRSQLPPPPPRPVEPAPSPAPATAPAPASTPAPGVTP